MDLFATGDKYFLPVMKIQVKFIKLEKLPVKVKPGEGFSNPGHIFVDFYECSNDR